MYQDLLSFTSFGKVHQVCQVNQVRQVQQGGQDPRREGRNRLVSIVKVAKSNKFLMSVKVVKFVTEDKAFLLIKAEVESNQQAKDISEV